MRSSQQHWQRIYAERDPVELSWHETEPINSLQLIDQAGLPPDAAILDAGGGGGSSLARELIGRGYRDITVADISEAALSRARAELGEAAGRADFVLADLRGHQFPRRYDLWHDRAVFHFMVDTNDREAYLATIRRSLASAGHLILATFGPEGPTSCSGLPVNRYGSEELSALLGTEFDLLTTHLQDHTTPSSAHQQFLWTHWRRISG